MDKEFYVYVYRDPLDGTPVYVGKGRGNRAISHTWLKSRTNDRLGKLVVNRAEQGHAMEPEIVARCSEENALLIEQALIKYFGRAELGEGPLCNSTDGGDGVSNPSVDQIRWHKCEIKARKPSRAVAGAWGPNYPHAGLSVRTHEAERVPVNTAHVGTREA